MADTQKIEYHLQQDIRQRLLDYGVTPSVIVEHEKQPEEAQFIRVRCMNLAGSLLGGKIPTGMRRATMAVEINSYQDDDQNGETLHDKVEEVRDAIYRDDILDLLTADSSYHTYYGMEDGDDVPDFEEGYRVQSIQFDLIMKPENT